MNNQNLKIFNQEVHNKYLVFNTLFSRLPYDKVYNVGMLMPFLYDISRYGFDNNQHPFEIVSNFFNQYTKIESEKEQIDMLFRFIKYIERQVVLFDSIEDAAFDKIYLPNEKGSIQYLINLVTQTEKTQQLKEKIKNFKTRLVFTAHPTQFYPNNVLRIIHELQENSKINNISGIDELLQQLGKTPFINKIKPTPIEEAQSILYYLRHVFYSVINDIHTKIYNKILVNDEFEPILELGFWPGGDRDGNPFVTSDVTKKVAQELRQAILKCYYNHLKEIRRKLTFKNVFSMIQSIHQKIYNNMFGLENDLTAEILTKELFQIRKILLNQHDGMFIEKLDTLIQSVKIFGLFFASLDIRQDSSIHIQIMEEINRKQRISNKNYSDWDDEQKTKFLIEYEYQFNKSDFKNEIHIDTFKTIQLIKELQKSNGEKSCNRYIISNSTSHHSVLEVLALFRFSGYQTKDIYVNIIPLFETNEGLNGAKNTMKILYELDYYKKHLHIRHNFQYIMLGFSDGTKDVGYLKANWGIYETKKILSKISKKYSIKVVFFDGRGGPPARGGGKTHQFYASLGTEIANHEIQLTIQGQTITSMYGSRAQAKYNFEQLLTAGISNDILRSSQEELSYNDHLFIQKLSEISLKSYLDLKNHPLFISYLENNSPLNFYGSANIGSRPTKRLIGKKLKLKDLRAIPFVGSWSQIKQNVPGYHGLGTAIQIAINNKKLEYLQNIYSKSLYFRTLVQNSMMALSKTNFSITKYMQNDRKYGKFWKLLYDEYQLAKKNILLVSKQKFLMQDELVNKTSIEFREKIILPLLTIQQYAMQKIQIEYDKKKRKIFENMITRTLFGIINSSRNSA